MKRSLVGSGSIKSIYKSCAIIDKILNLMSLEINQRFNLSFKFHSLGKGHLIVRDVFCRIILDTTTETVKSSVKTINSVF